MLRPLQEAEVSEAYIEGLNDPEVHRFLVGPRRDRQTRATVEHFVRENLAAPDAALFGLFIDQRLRGTLRLHDIRHGVAWLGLALFDKSVWGQGWARKMIAAAVHFASRELHVKEIRAGIEKENVASRRAFEAAGFVHATQADRFTEFGVTETWCWRADPGGVLTITDNGAV